MCRNEHFSLEITWLCLWTALLFLWPKVCLDAWAYTAVSQPQRRCNKNTSTFNYFGKLKLYNQQFSPCNIETESQRFESFAATFSWGFWTDPLSSLLGRAGAEWLDLLCRTPSAEAPPASWSADESGAGIQPRMWSWVNHVIYQLARFQPKKTVSVDTCGVHFDHDANEGEKGFSMLQIYVFASFKSITMFQGDQGRCLVALRCRRFAVFSSNLPVLHPLDSFVRSPWQSAGLPFLSQFAAFQGKKKKSYPYIPTKSQWNDPHCLGLARNCMKTTDPPELI